MTVVDLLVIIKLNSVSNVLKEFVTEIEAHAGVPRVMHILRVHKMDF